MFHIGATAWYLTGDCKRDSRLILRDSFVISLSLSNEAAVGGYKPNNTAIIPNELDN